MQNGNDKRRAQSMMTSSNGNIFRVTGHLCGEFTGPRWIPCKKGQWRGALFFSLICVWINVWVNNREAGDLRRYRAPYELIVMGETNSRKPPNISFSRENYGVSIISILELIDVLIKEHNCINLVYI